MTGRDAEDDRRPARSGTLSARVKLPPARAPGSITSSSAPALPTVVPVIAELPRRANHPRVLVVLPTLTWQGQNPVDDPHGDGIPNTLDTGGPIAAPPRPLVGRAPPGFADEAGFLTYLDKQHLQYDLTTDLALINGPAPKLAGTPASSSRAGRRGSRRRSPPQLRAYVQHGGHVLSLGIDSLRRGVTVSGNRRSIRRSPDRTTPFPAVRAPSSPTTPS